MLNKTIKLSTRFSLLDRVDEIFDEAINELDKEQFVKFMDDIKDRIQELEDNQ